MASCAACGAEGLAPEQACPRCGAAPAPELELDLRAKPKPRPAAPRKKVVEEVSLELAVDPRELTAQRAAESHAAPVHDVPVAAPPSLGGAAASAQVVRSGAMAKAPGAPLAEASDVESDARVLADFGEPPRSWLTAPLYAWRVLRRQRELKTALAGRRTEAEHAAAELEGALVAFAERVRPAAEKLAAYQPALAELVRAEENLRSRDQVLAAEQDARKARLGQVDARLAKLEGELAQAHEGERLAAQELAAAQGALAREEAHLRRAEVELRAAQTAKDGAARE